MFKFVMSSAFTLTLAAAVPTSALASDADIKAALAGKTITSGKSVLKIRKNGRITGKVGQNGDVKFEGAWAIRDGKWCRTIKLPESYAGTECMALSFGDGTVSFDGSRGTSVWVIK